MAEEEVRVHDHPAQGKEKILSTAYMLLSRTSTRARLPSSLSLAMSYVRNVVVGEGKRAQFGHATLATVVAFA